MTLILRRWKTNKMSCAIAPVYCLKIVSKLCHRKGAQVEPSGHPELRVWENKLTKVCRTECQRQDCYTEGTLEICKNRS